MQVSSENFIGIEVIGRWEERMDGRQEERIKGRDEAAVENKNGVRHESWKFSSLRQGTGSSKLTMSVSRTAQRRGRNMKRIIQSKSRLKTKEIELPKPLSSLY